MGEKNGHGRAAKRRTKLLVLADRYREEDDSETSERYVELASEIEARLRAAGACVACGRPLKNPASLESGYGEECATNLEKEED